jgi:hypothetical protein
MGCEPSRHTECLSIPKPGYWLEGSAFLELNGRAERICDGKAEEGAADSVAEGWK